MFAGGDLTSDRLGSVFFDDSGRGVMHANNHRGRAARFGDFFDHVTCGARAFAHAANLLRAD